MIARILIVLGLGGIAAPAAAQITDRGWTPGRKAPAIFGDARAWPMPAPIMRSDLREKIRDGRESGQLSRCEARGFRRAAASVNLLARRDAVNDLPGSETPQAVLLTAVLGEQINNRRLGLTASADKARC